MTEKRFTVHRTIGMLPAFYVNDNLSDKVVIDQIIHKYEADRLCELLNSLNDENEQLKYTLSAYMVDLNNCKGKCSTLEIENEQLKKEIKKLETFKKILDYAEKDMEERVDWQSYCEKEFEGL